MAGPISADGIEGSVAHVLVETVYASNVSMNVVSCEVPPAANNVSEETATPR